MLGTMLGLSYSSSVAAAFMSMMAGFIIIPKLNIVSDVEGLKELPEILFFRCWRAKRITRNFI